MKSSRLVLALATLITFVAYGCDDEGGETVYVCPADHVFDETAGYCLRVGGDDMLIVEDFTAPDFTQPDSSVPDTGQLPDGESDGDAMAVEVDMDDPCDRDKDGVRSEECGGQDCDDNSFSISPQRREACDDIDNNCDGNNNEGLNCTFYANTNTELYQIDPIARTVSDPIPLVRHPDEGDEMQWLVDVDTAPDGTLYGVARNFPEDGSVLYVFDEWTHFWSEVGTTPDIEFPSGLAIDSGGTAFVLAGDSTYTIDLFTAQATLVGQLGGGFFASGDCVMNKSDDLYMTSKEAGQNDTLVLVDRQSGVGTGIGLTNVPNIYGLTAAWGKLYGVADGGELVEIDQIDGSATTVVTFPVSWWGAASSPTR